MRNYLIIASTLLLFTFCVHAEDGTKIKVLLIDPVSGKPLANREVLVYRMNPETHMPITEEGLPLKGTTDKEGSASFAVSSLLNRKKNGATGESHEQSTPQIRLSKYLDLTIIYASAGVQCSTGQFSLDDILKSGVVGDNRCSKGFDSTKFNAAPGEVIIFIRKYHWWEGMQT